MPVMHWAGWGETRQEWLQQGLNPDISEHEFLMASGMGAGISVNLDIYPLFEEKVLEETDSYRVIRQGDGVIAKHSKIQSVIPQYLDYVLKGQEGWDEFKKRLQPDPARIPSNLDEQICNCCASGLPVCINAGSLVGWIRNWMGVENLSYLCYDDRPLFREMVNTIADLVIWGFDQILPKITADAATSWEDICFRSGPLISPKIFAEAVVPAHRRISDRLRYYGVDLYSVDCDGYIDDLIPLWLEGGVNIMFPFEIGAWNADPMAARKKYGRQLRIFGGINKLELAKGKESIDAEIERRKPLMAEGGYIPLPDHLIIPGTKLSDYRYYLEKIRELRF